MSLLSEFLAVTQDWRDVFPQQRTFQRAVRQALGRPVPLSLGSVPLVRGLGLHFGACPSLGVLGSAPFSSWPRFYSRCSVFFGGLAPS
jgi:hypothetical protein